MPDFKRLSTAIKPELYRVHFYPDLATFTFRGTVSIDFTVDSGVDEVVLNAKELTIQSVKIGDTAVTYKLDDDSETLTCITTLAPGQYTLDIEYTGIHNDKRMGFYRTKFEADDGTIHWGLASHFEPVQARYALPCFDEPAIRAKFAIKATVSAELTALSCMETTSVENVDNGTKTMFTFATTPSMSTYLLAICIGKYDHVEGKTNSGIAVRIYANKGESPKCAFALEVATRCLDWYEKYFNVNYPLKKCDLIAIPDFTGGAMENWGLITFRSSCILFDAAVSTDEQRERIAIIIAHELAHMWFGNLVTVEWWTHLWLKEGFASYLQYHSIDCLYPQWNVWNNMVNRAYITARNIDSLRTSHPVEVPVSDPGAINEIFDTVSYLKGCCIIRMLYDWLGQEAMQKGLSQYLAKYQYGAASTEQLWAELDSVAQMNVPGVMANWTGKLGYPMIAISQNDGDGVTIKQSKFNLDGQCIDSDANDSTVWMVPITFKSDVETIKVVFDKRDDTVAIKSNKWLNVNLDSAGFFITKLSEPLLQRMLSHLSELDVSDRLKLVYDQLQLSKSGHASSGAFFDMLVKFKTENNFYVWNLLINGLGYIESISKTRGMKQQAEQFAIDCIRPTIDRVGLADQAGDDYSMPKLRAALVYELGMYKDQKIIDFALAEFNMIKTDAATNVNQEMKSKIFYIMGRLGDQFESLKKLHAASNMPAEKNILERAIGHARSEESINQALEFALSDAVRNCDQLYVLSELVVHSDLGLAKVWLLIKERLEFLKENYG